MDSYLVSAITLDVQLAAMFGGRTPDLWFYSSSSLGLGENQELPGFPYVVYNELPSSPYREVFETSNAEQKIYTFHVYDEMGDYDRINTILRHIRRIVKGMAPFTTADGAIVIRCSDSRWDGVSGRIVDPEYHSGVRIGTGRFTVSN